MGVRPGPAVESQRGARRLDRVNRGLVRAGLGSIHGVIRQREADQGSRHFGIHGLNERLTPLHRHMRDRRAGVAALNDDPPGGAIGSAGAFPPGRGQA